MKKLKDLLIRILIIIVMLIIMNIIYERFYYEKDIQRYSPLINMVREMDIEAKILYLGEASNKTFHKDDLDKRKISQMLNDFYPEIVVEDITKPAAHVGIYYHLLRQIPKDSKVNTVVVTLNLRSFGMDWMHSKLESPLQKSLVLLRPYPALINRMLLSFKAYSNIQEKEGRDIVKKLWKNEEFDTTKGFEYPSVFRWDRGMALKGIRDKEGKYDKSQTELACHFVKSYAFVVDTISHPRMEDLDRIVELSEKRGWNLVFNLMAENMEKAEQLVGSQLTMLMSENRNKLKVYLEGKGAIVVDNLELIEDIEYIDQHWTTEHYTEKGRKQIASNVAEAISILHENEYVDTETNFYQSYKFFNNCESKLQWGQESSYTDEYSYSGRYASRAQKSSPYSLTFDCSMDKLPDDRRKEVNVQFAFMNADSGGDAKLVIDVTDNSGTSHWYGEALDPLMTEIENGEWGIINISHPIVVNAERIKIYVLNNHETPVFVDDFKVEFK